MRLPAAVLLLTSLFLTKVARSQSNELIVQGQTGKLYLEHTVVAKETWYSIGRLYNLSPKVIAPFNSLTLDKTLTVGETLQIPLIAANFSQDEARTTDETLVPVYHIVQEKEWMYRISVNHNKAPIASLEKWNHITGNDVHPGLHMIIGFLKVKTALSALADPPRDTTHRIVTARSDDTFHAKVAVKPPVDTTRAIASKPPTPKPAPTDPPAPHFNGGVFRSDFTEGGRSAAGLAGTFKSTSGWQDGKYYALMNNVPVGTIARVTDPTTSKSVFVKVLGQLPDMKESAGIVIRISNAAAAELGQSDNRFNVSVNY
jgi:hypothetical protein